MILSSWLSSLKATKASRRFGNRIRSSTKRKRIGTRWFNKPIHTAEVLEDRTLLTAHPLNVFADFDGEIASSEASSTITVHLTSENFEIGSGQTTLGFEVFPAEGSDFIAAPVTVTSDGSGGVPVILESELSEGRSLVLAKLKHGDYEIQISGVDGSVGAWELHVFLAGDVNGDFVVDTTDKDLIKDVLKGKITDPDFFEEADSNRDGEITGFDLARASGNKGASTSVRILTVTTQLDPASDTGILGDSLVNQTPVAIVGLTLQGAEVFLDLDGDGFDDGSTIATSGVDPNYSLAADLVLGANTLVVEARDSFGQTVQAQTIVTYDNVAPTVVSTSPVEGAIVEAEAGVNIPVEYIFSEEMIGASVLSALSVFGNVSGAITPINPTYDADAGKLQFELSHALSDTSISVEVAGTATDLAGNGLGGGDFTLNFTVNRVVTITSISPANGEEMVSLTREAIVRFSGPIDPATVAGTFSQDTVTFTSPSIRFSGGRLRSGNDNFAEGSLYVEAYAGKGGSNGHFHIRTDSSGFFELQHAGSQGFFIERVDGSAFDLVSLDFRNRFGGTPSIRLGTSIASLAPVATASPSMSSFTTLPITGFDGVTRVFVSTSGGTVDFDNIVVQTVVTPPAIRAIALGGKVRGRLVVSSTERFVTFFPNEPWNASTEIRIEIDGNRIIGRNGEAVDADGDSVAGGQRTADFRTLSITRIPGTNVFGFVRDSFSGAPIVGATIRVDAFPEANAVTDANGRFELTDMPAPEFFVHVDGSTSSSAPEGFVYPNVGKPFHSVPGQTVQIEMNREPFDIFLPALALSDVQALSATEPTDVGFGDAGKAKLAEMFPDVDPSMFDLLKVTFAPGAAVDDFGNPATEASIIPVPPDRIPAPLPPNLNPQLVISIQAGGATNFDVPASIAFPNLDGLAPGERSLIFSFNHDAGRFEVIGTGTVSEDGSVVVSDPGVGILAPGWHFTQPGTQRDEEVQKPKEKTRQSLFDAGIGFARNSAAQFFNSLSFLSAVTDDIPIVGQTPLVDQVLNVVTAASGALADVIDDGQIGAGTIASAQIALLGALDPDPITGTILDTAGLVLATNSLIESSIRTNQAGRDFFDALIDAATDWAQTVQDLETETRAFGDHLIMFLDGVDGVRAALNAVNRQPTSDPVIVAQFITGMTSIFDSRAFFVEKGPGSVDAALANIEAGYRNTTVEFGEMFGNLFEPATNVPYTIVLENGTIVASGNTDAAGRLNAILPSNQVLKITVANSLQGEVITRFLATGQSGSRSAGTFFLAPIVGTDTDGDGLLDEAEQVLRTDPNLVDTDGDGITDRAEIEQGLDPLDNRGFPTGVISSLPLPGTVEKLAVEGDFIYAATGSHGLAIVDGTQFNNPILLGQIDLPGNATGVGVDPNLQIAAVATGSQLQLVDLSDPMMPELIRSVGVGATRVEVSDGLGYATSGNRLSVVDLLTGDVIQSLTLPGFGSVTGLARDGSFLYAYVSGSDRLAVVDISTEGEAFVAGSTFVSVASGDVGVFAGNGVVWVAGSGLRTVDVSDPTNPTLIHGADNFFTARRIALNGSGLGVLAPDRNNFIQVYDVSDLNNTNAFLTQFPLSGGARNVAISRGIAYVGAGNRLEVVNYLPFDSNGIAPTVSITSLVADLDPGTEGIQLLEGTSIPIQADVSDDVQVRNVELLVNGQVVRNDVSFPFDFSAIALSDDPEEMVTTVQVRATDTGGNVALSNILMIDLVPDTFAPTILSIDPANGAVRPQGHRTVRVRFSESLDAAGVTSDNFKIIEAGMDTVFGTGDDVPVPVTNIQLRSDDRLVQLTTDALGVGFYQIGIQEDTITDRAGNALGTGIFTSDFEVVEAIPITITFGSFSHSHPLSYTESGLTVTSRQNHVHLHSGVLLNHGNCCSTPYQFDFEGGAPFSVVSVDVISSFRSGSFTSSSGAVMPIVETGTITFPAEGWTNLTSFRWDEPFGNAVIDNLSILATPTGGNIQGTIVGMDSQINDISRSKVERLAESATIILVGSFALDTVPVFEITIADLPGNILASASLSSVAGEANITVDTNAAGIGWFVDSTAFENEEFTLDAGSGSYIAAPDSPAAGRYDLLTVLLHEIGHVIGFEHSDDPNSFMVESLSVGVRRLPGDIGHLESAEIENTVNFDSAIPIFQIEETNPDWSSDEAAPDQTLLSSHHLYAESNTYALTNDSLIEELNFDLDEGSSSIEPVPYLPEDDLQADSFFSEFEDTLLDDLLAIS